MGDEIGKVLYFFPDFMKKDFFNPKNLKVIDVALGACHTLILCYDMQEKRNRLFGCGSSKFGQLGYGGSLTQHSFMELTK